MTSAVLLPLIVGGCIERVWTARVRAVVRPEYSGARLVVDPEAVMISHLRWTPPERSFGRLPPSGQRATTSGLW